MMESLATSLFCEMVRAVGVLPVMEFRFGQFPKFFETQEFFLLASQLLIEIFTGITTGLIGAIVNGLFGVTG